MSAVVGGTFIGLFFVIWAAVLIVPTIFFILTQQRALSKCAPMNQSMSPGLVWLQIIPFFNFIWQFFVVSALANSLGREFRARGIQEEERPGQGVGLAMCITRVCVIIPILGIISLIASVVLWIIYWVKIAEFSRKLDFAPGTGYGALSYNAPSQQAPYQSGYSSYGQVGSAPAPSNPPATGAAPAPSSQPASAPTPATPAAAAPSPAARSCASCGATLSPDSAFCQQCGAKVD